MSEIHHDTEARDYLKLADAEDDPALKLAYATMAQAHASLEQVNAMRWMADELRKIYNAL